MSQENINQVNDSEQEIDVIALLQRFWCKRKFILIVAGCCLIIGVFLTLSTPKEYTARSVFVPQVSSSSSQGTRLRGLASMVGISLGNMEQTSILSPMVYPNILNNVDLEKELIYSKFKFDEIKDSVTFFDYYTNPEYRKTSLFVSIRKYTIGLPFVILRAMRGKKEDVVLGEKSSLIMLTEKESRCVKMLKSKISLEIDSKNGYLMLTTKMPTAITAAQLALYTQDLLQKYITEFRIDKAKQQLEYIDGRYREAKKEYEKKQEAYARFRDANRQLATAVAKAKGQRLEDEYNLANTLYTQLATQKMQAEMQVKEDTPVLTVIEPVLVPNRKSKPQGRRIVFVSVFLGFAIGCAGVISLDYLKKTFETNNIKILRKWE